MNVRLNKNRHIFIINGVAYRPFAWELEWGSSFERESIPLEIHYTGNDLLTLEFQDRTVSVSFNHLRHTVRLERRRSQRAVVNIDNAAITWVSREVVQPKTVELSESDAVALHQAAKLALRALEDYKSKLELQLPHSGMGASIVQENIMRLGMPIWHQKRALEILKDF